MARKKREETEKQPELKVKKPRKAAKRVAAEKAEKKPEVQKQIENVSGSVDELADCVLNNPVLVAQLKALGFESKNPNGMTFREAMICSQIANAVRGDLKAYQEVMKYTKTQKSPLERFVAGVEDLPMEILTGE